MTKDEERGFKEIEDIWERLKTAEIVYDKHGTPVVSTGSGVEEIEEGEEEKQGRLATAANLGASKVLRWLRSLNPDPVYNHKADKDSHDARYHRASVLDRILTENLCRSLCWHLEAERLFESLHNFGKLSPSPILDWINDGLDPFARPPPGAIYYWPGAMLIAHLRATLYWHESPDVSIDVLSKFQGHNRTKQLTAMVCTSSQIRNHCEKNESYDKFLELELSRLQRAIAMLWHPTEPDALPLSNFNIELRARKKNSEEARALTNANVPINSKFERDIIRAQYLLLLQDEEQQVESLLQSVPSRVVGLAARRRRVELFDEYRHDPRLKKLHAQCPRLKKIWNVLNEKKAFLQRQIEQAKKSRKKREAKLQEAMEQADLHQVRNVLNEKRVFYKRQVEEAEESRRERETKLQVAMEQADMQQDG